MAVPEVRAILGVVASFPTARALTDTGAARAWRGPLALHPDHPAPLKTGIVTMENIQSIDVPQAKVS
jgi:hypothetical protein